MHPYGVLEARRHRDRVRHRRRRDDSLAERAAARSKRGLQRIRMKTAFGVFDHIERRGNSLDGLFEGRLKLLEQYDAAGFYGYHLAEHHATPLGMAPSPGLFLAAAAQRTRRIRLGPLVYLLPLYNPFRLATEICMLDHLSNGRLDLGVGRGVSPFEVAYYGVSFMDSREMFEEALQALVKG